MIYHLFPWTRPLALSWSPGPASQSYSQSLPQAPPPTPPTSLTPAPPVQALAHPHPTAASAPRRGGAATLPPPGLSASRIPSSNPPSSEGSGGPPDPARTFFHDNKPGIKEISESAKQFHSAHFNTCTLKNAVIVHKKIFILTCSGFIVVILK